MTCPYPATATRAPDLHPQLRRATWPDGFAHLVGQQHDSALECPALAAW